jgi:hypothetical protein
MGLAERAGTRVHKWFHFKKKISRRNYGVNAETLNINFRQRKRLPEPSRQCFPTSFCVRQKARQIHELIHRMRYNLLGGVGERLKPAVLKTVGPERVPGVRIPPPPPSGARFLSSPAKGLRKAGVCLCRFSMCRSLSARRIGLEFFSWRASIDAATAVGSILGKQLDWSAEQTEGAIRKYVDKI